MPHSDILRGTRITKVGSSWQERPELHLSDLIPATLLLLQKYTRQVAPADAAMHWVRAGHNKSAIDFKDLYGFLQTLIDFRDLSGEDFHIFINSMFHGRGRKKNCKTPGFAEDFARKSLRSASTREVFSASTSRRPKESTSDPPNRAVGTKNHSPGPWQDFRVFESAELSCNLFFCVLNDSMI